MANISDSTPSTKASISNLNIKQDQVGGGIDLADMLDKLTTVEKKALTPISNQQSANTARLSGYGTLKSSLTTFQAVNARLNSADLFTATTAISSSTAFSATTSGSSKLAGTYTINVKQLAQAQLLTSTVQSSNTAALGDSSVASRSIAITLKDGTSKSVSLSTAQTSLTGMRDAINGANAGINASIIKVSDGSFRLSISASKTGSDNAVARIAVTGDNTLQRIVGFDTSASSNAMTQSIAAQNAKLTVNNVDIENSSNQISDALEGITLNLTAQSGGDQTLTINKDTTKASSAVSDWVDAYNTLRDQFNTLTKYNKVKLNAESQDSSNGPLLGDGTLRTIETQLKSMLTNAQSTSTFKSLSQIGVNTDPKTGSLKLDSTKLSAALDKDSAGVKAMIVGDGKTGIAAKIDSKLTDWLGTRGIVQTATDGVSKTLNRLTDLYNATNDRIETHIKRYKDQFIELNKLYIQLNSTSSFLKQNFETTSKS